MIVPRAAVTYRRNTCSLPARRSKTPTNSLTVSFLSWWDIDCSGNICFSAVSVGSDAASLSAHRLSGEVVVRGPRTGLGPKLLEGGWT